MGSHSSSRAGGGGGGRGRRPPPPPPPPRGDPDEEAEVEAEAEEEEDEDVDLAQVLAYLLRRGQTGPAGGGGEAAAFPPHLEEEEEEEEEGGGAGSDPPPAPPPGGALANHELRAELELALGRGGGARAPEENLTRMVQERQWGRSRHGSFSPGERSRLSSHFLPNHVAFADSYPQKAFCGVFSQDGELLLTACQDQTLRVYECRGPGPRLLRTWRGRDVGWSILDVAFTPDRSQALYSSWSDYIHVFNIYGDSDDHTALDLRPEERRFAVFSLAVGPGGRDVLGGANDGCIYLYDRGAQRRLLRVPAHEDDVNALALGDAGEGQLLLSGGDDGVCRVWDLRGLGEGRSQPVAILAGHRDGVTFIHPRGDSRYFVSNSKDQTAKLWDLRRPTGPGGLAAARRAVARQSWDYRWQRAPPRAMTTAPLPGDTSLMTYRGHVVLHTLLRCRLAPPPGRHGGAVLCAGCASGAILMYDVLSGRVLKRLTNHSACVRDVCWHPRGDWLASASWDGSVCLWDYRDPQDEDDPSPPPPAPHLPIAP